MNETLLTNVLKCKLDLAHAMIGLLPETLQTPVKKAEHDLLHAVQEVVMRVLEENKTDLQGENSKGLKTIQVD